MKKIEVSELTDNVFTTIGKEWMLVTAGTKDKFNMMTASWGCLGWLWNKPVAVMIVAVVESSGLFVVVSAVAIVLGRSRHESQDEGRHDEC